MPQSKKQMARNAKSNKERIAEIERELRLPILDAVKKADLQYELERLKRKG